MQHQSSSLKSPFVTRAYPLFYPVVASIVFIFINIGVIAAQLEGLPWLLEFTVAWAGISVPCLWFLWATSGRVTIDQHGFTLSRFGKQRFIKAADLVGVHVHNLTDAGAPCSFRLRGSDGTKIHFRVEKSQAENVVNRVQHHLATRLATEENIRIGSQPKLILSLVAVLLTVLVPMLSDDSIWFVAGMFLVGYALATLYAFHSMVRLTLTPTGFTTDFVAPWRATRQYGRDEIKAINLFQAHTPRGNRRVTTVIKLQNGAKLPLVSATCGNFFAYFALKTWRDQALAGTNPSGTGR